MRIRNWVIAACCYCCFGCASNGSGGDQPGMEVAAPVETVSEQRPADNSFASVNFFRGFAEQASADPVAALSGHFSDDAAVAYVAQQQAVEQPPVFIDLPWQQMLPQALEKMMSQLAVYKSWEFIDSEGGDEYVESYFALSNGDQFDYIRLTWNRAQQSIVDVRQMLYQFGVVPALVALDDVFDDPRYTDEQKVNFLQMLHAINSKNLTDYYRYYRQLPAALQQHPVHEDRLLKVVSSGAGTAWQQVVSKFWVVDQPRSESRYYNYYTSLKDYAAAERCLNSLPERLRGHVGVLVERSALYWEREELAWAEHYANAAILSDPYLALPYYMKLGIALKAGDHQGALLTLMVLKERFNVVYSRAALTEIEGGAAFNQSDFARDYFG